MSERIYDVVIWGASGFTGRLVVEYMYRAYGRSGDVRWAVAGRNEQKLQQLFFLRISSNLSFCSY